MLWKGLIIFRCVQLHKLPVNVQVHQACTLTACSAHREPDENKMEPEDVV